VNVGSEQNGHEETFLRPVVVLKKYVSGMFLCLPLTSRGKTWPDYFKLSHPSGTMSYAILSQGKTLDRKRFAKYVLTLSRVELEKLIQVYKDFI